MEILGTVGAEDVLGDARDGLMTEVAAEKVDFAEDDFLQAGDI